MLRELLIFSTANMSRKCGELSPPARSRLLRASGTCENISLALSPTAACLPPICWSYATELIELCMQYTITRSLRDSELASFLWCFFFCWWHWLVCLKCVLFLQGLESADEPCRTERCRPDGMMGRRNEVRRREIFRSQHKGSMVINVDNCFVFDSLGSTSHTHTIESHCFYVFLALTVFGVCWYLCSAPGFLDFCKFTYTIKHRNVIL